MGSGARSAFIAILSIAGTPGGAGIESQLMHSRAAQFADYVARYSRTYRDEAERARRFASFVENMDHIDKLNAHPHMDGHTAEYGINEFSDWYPEEKARLFGGVAPNPVERGDDTCPQVLGCCGQCIPNTTEASKGPVPPDSWDWREYRNANGQKVVTPIANQGKCGSCWAFSATANVETAWLLAGYPAVGDGTLSVQRVLDCVYPMMNSSQGQPFPHSSPNCSGGGLVEEGIEYALNYGIPSASSDSYQCEKGCADGSLSCKSPFPLPRPDASAKPTAPYKKSWITQCCGSNSAFLCGNDAPNEPAIRRAVATYGLLSIDVNARNWVGYTSGIMKAHCDPVAMNHAVILAGYGTDIVNGIPVDYWLIRNSWGTTWGEQGYGRLYRDNSTNVCGFATSVWLTSANRTDAKDGPIYIDECPQPSRL